MVPITSVTSLVGLSMITEGPPVCTHKEESIAPPKTPCKVSVSVSQIVLSIPAFTVQFCP